MSDGHNDEFAELFRQHRGAPVHSTIDIGKKVIPESDAGLPITQQQQQQSQACQEQQQMQSQRQQGAKGVPIRPRNKGEKEFVPAWVYRGDNPHI